MRHRNNSNSLNEISHNKFKCMFFIWSIHIALKWPWEQTASHWISVWENFHFKNLRFSQKYLKLRGFVMRYRNWREIFNAILLFEVFTYYNWWKKPWWSRNPIQHEYYQTCKRSLGQYPLKSILTAGKKNMEKKLKTKSSFTSSTISGTCQALYVRIAFSISTTNWFRIICIHWTIGSAYFKINISSTSGTTVSSNNCRFDGMDTQKYSLKWNNDK